MHPKRRKSRGKSITGADKKKVVKLDLSPKKDEGFVGMVEDIRHDPLELPWPVRSDSVTLISAASVVHRVDPRQRGFIKFMDEAWRVLKEGGQMRIATPYGVNTGFISDPLSLNACTPQTFHYFDPQQGTKLYERYKPRPWKIESCYWQVDGLMEVLLSKPYK